MLRNLAEEELVWHRGLGALRADGDAGVTGHSSRHLRWHLDHTQRTCIALLRSLWLSTGKCQKALDESVIAAHGLHSLYTCFHYVQ